MLIKQLLQLIVENYYSIVKVFTWPLTVIGRYVFKTKQSIQTS
ncbi:hypothetical protein NTG1052_50041 [Candidatus Nitrotoga sp. 1052]|nr:hypothetical protein NTG1052_50041 [Candidatus Nitrotoga sp. 1052]